MSIAHDFDPDVSPIYEDDDDETQHSVHFSSADTPKRSGRVSSSHVDRTLGTTHIYEETTSSAHQYHKECVHDPEDSEVLDSRPSDQTDEVVPDSTECLSDTFIILSAGCCLPIRHHLSKCLTEMGATLQKEVDQRTSHIVVDRYADEVLVGEAMNRMPTPPMMVDITWIQECMDQRQRCEETDFSMRGARFLKKTCKRLSTFREVTPFREAEAEDDETIWLDMESEESQDPAELLAQIRLLSERIDALQNYAPIIRFEYHSPDCPTRQRFSAPPPEVDVENQNLNPNPNPNQNPKNRTNTNKILNLLNTISTNSVIKRRRSFTGFLLEHRRPEEDLDAAKIREASRDTRDTWKAPEIGGTEGKRRKVVHNAVNDMRKTMAMNLTQIRDTYQRNANLNKARTPKKKAPPKTRKEKPIPVRADDSDIQSALASLTISSPPPQRPLSESVDVEVIDISNRRREPLVVTRSAFINQLQVRQDFIEEDDFISDVSAFHMQRKNGQKRKEMEDEKNGVVFTGFSKDSPIEKRLKSILRRFKLHVSAEIDERTTRCVVSRHGKRTLMVLKAICMEIPVVRPQWLEESHEDSLLLPHVDYIFQEWRLIENSKVFENSPKFWIAEECAPSREDLSWMVEKCGGKITRKSRRAGILIAPENWKLTENLEIRDGSEICKPLFVIDSVSKGEIQEVDDYLVEI